MINFNIILFIVTIICLIIATISDIKKRNISNKLILFMIIAGITIAIIQTIIFSSWSYILNTIKSIIITFIIGYILWEIGALAGGDIKLFVGISTLNPINLNILGKALGYQTISKPIFGITIIIISILSTIPFLFTWAIYGIFGKKYYLILWENIKSKKTLFSFLNTIILLIFISSVLNIFSIKIPYILTFIISIFLIFIFSKIQKYNIKLFYGILTIVYIGLIILNIFGTIKNIFVIKDMLIIVGMVIITFIIINTYKIITQKILIQEKQIDALKEGEVPYYSYYEENNKIIPKKTNILTTIKQMTKGEYQKNLKIDSNKAKGLSEQDITLLKQWYKNNLIEDKIKIKKTIAFTPSVMIAYVLLNIFGDFLWIMLF
jgi:preflagellin peptidase FlaK